MDEGAASIDRSMVDRTREIVRRGWAVAPQRDRKPSGGAAELGAIAVPLASSQLDQARESLASWTATVPSLVADEKTVDLVVIVNDSEHASMTDLFSSAAIVHQSFRRLTVLSAGLSGEDDQYKIGDATGANNLFFFTFAAMANYDTFFLMETDCRPMIDDWLTAATRCVATEMGTKWMMGAQYRGGGPLDAEYWRHINGNAFYRTGSPEFRQFFVDEFLPFYGARYDDDGFRFGYDAAFELFLNQSSDRKRAATLLSKFAHTDFVVNIRAQDDPSGLPCGEGGEGVLWHRGGWSKRTN